MMLETDLAERTVSFSLSKKIYSLESLKIANHIFSSKAEVLLADSKDELEVTLRSKKKVPTESDLSALGGEFLNELLNQEYRFLVGGFNQKISNLIVTQALMAARGGENPAKAPAEEQTPQFKAAVAAMIKEAEAEVKKTMPRKLPPQGTPLPPAKEDAGV